MPIIQAQTATATDSPDGSVSDDATAVLISESPAAGDIWYVEGFWAISDGAGSDVTAANYQAGTAIWPSEATDAEIGSTVPTGDVAARGATETSLGDRLANATDGAWLSVGDLMHPNEKAVLNITADGTSSSSTLTYRLIARQVV